ncbi:hypothetical protein PYW07_017477 [Mythimna separata]|uniref:Raptor N-terminal CASPase-like domain-containing protein n=1 Tax=Mythimna separata TaxID=271217 RepID=A0AAD7YXU8_MYTSE|nr:hypothetical protein PYW07_017477 [Mythimna separata]
MTEMPPYLAVKDEEKNSGQGDSDTSSDVDDWDLPLSFDKPRHLEPIKGAERVEHTWRVKEKYKTHCVALVLCLNVGVDPPDVVKTQPCARLECWIDPQSLSPSKALESIGHALQSQYERWQPRARYKQSLDPTSDESQYERWQPRARYKQSLDPTSDEVKKLCCSLRRNAKDERVLFHYNGHGVPKPTTQGEIWVFNRAYTQYIPLSMYDLQTWMGAPSLYVYDCSNAGVIVDNFKQFADQHEREYEAQLATKSEEGGAAVPPAVSYKNCIQLAACAAGQALPMNPELPADLFTACLTTPVKMAMKWFALRERTRVAPSDVHELIDKIPGQVTDRRTMLGELNWIFTAITDTIAWSSLPPELFQQLFRADLLTASLCRNFLLADRIMRSYNCTPVSLPALPSLAAHPLWAAWEHTLDLALAQLPRLLRPDPDDYTHSPFFRDQLTAFQVWLDLGKLHDAPLWAAWEHTLDLALAQLPRLLRPDPDDYTHSPFFRDQLTAFQVWLDLGKLHDAPLWAAWEHTLDLALAQLPRLLRPDPDDYTHSPFFRDQLTAFQVWLDLGKLHDAPLWAAWEHTLDLALAQLPRLLRPDPDDYTHSPFFRDQLTAFQVWLDLGKLHDAPLWAAWEHTLDLALAQLPRLLRPDPDDYTHSPFFRDQLTAFQVWLDLGKWCGWRPPPAQLPMVLQVLLSTLHRVRALRLLCRFLALGAWAARAVLNVGIFPYMLKLLQASAPDLRASMVYIWAKIIAVDPVRNTPHH